MGLLIGFRNGPWAHPQGYSDHDVHQCLGHICPKLLQAVSEPAEQAQEVQRMWDELCKLILNQSAPERPRDAESDELRQRISEEVKKQVSEQMAQREDEATSTAVGDDRSYF